MIDRPSGGLGVAGQMLVFLALSLPSLSGCKGASPDHPDAAAVERLRAREAAAPRVAVDWHLLVDQFGYRPADPKVAVVRSPRVGFDAAATYEPGKTYEVRDAGDNRVVFRGALRAWHDGEVQDSSGDVGWWFDFTALVEPGRYYVYDVERQRRSATFRIAEDVYRDVLKAVTRMYYYQRSGFPKRAPYAEACWTDEASYLGPGQDLETRDVTHPDDRARMRDLSGGWHDAGDNNKYVTFAVHSVHQLLSAAVESPQAFTDDFGLPESGNGVPDVLDEVRWELAWLKKMQGADGRSALKVGTLKYGRPGLPSKDVQARYYVPECTSSTIAAAGMFAHAALVFRDVERLAPEVAELKARAIRGFDAYRAAPNVETDCDREYNGRRVLSGDADVGADDQADLAVLAATYLSAITSDARYDAYVEAHYRDTKPYHDIGWSRYSPYVGQALLQYATRRGGIAEVKRAILDDKREDAADGHQIYAATNDDLYRNFMHPEQYHWGSHWVRANYGGTNLDMVRLGLDAPNTDRYRMRALDTLHYFHGVNPFAYVYLTNMYRYGASRSVNTTWHGWFNQGTRWADESFSECGPAPGYLVGGPNANAVQDGVPEAQSPPAGQPLQKSFRDWNSNTEGSWAVTEASVGYQASYIRLLAAFVP